MLCVGDRHFYHGQQHISNMQTIYVSCRQGIKVYSCFKKTIYVPWPTRFQTCFLLNSRAGTTTLLYSLPPWKVIEFQHIKTTKDSYDPLCLMCVLMYQYPDTIFIM
jgi:hypothetical protein